MKRRVIGLIGNKESGKSTTARLIKEQFPTAQEVMLAGHLKRVLSEVFSLPLRIFEDQELKEKEILPNLILEKDIIQAIFKAFSMNLTEETLKKHLDKEFKTTRKIMQYVGTDVLRAIDPDIHLKWALKNVEAPLLIISDIRFPNEFDYFKNNTLFLSVGISRIQNKEKDLHSSEIQIEKMIEGCDVILKNNKDLEFFKEQIKISVFPKI